jgi:hypothetical protein
MIDRKKFLKLERALLRYRPTAGRPVPPRPADADAVLASLALFLRPGDRAGVRTIADIAGVTLGKAGAVRTWAKAAGVWPYLDDLAGLAAARARKGGAS